MKNIGKMFIFRSMCARGFLSSRKKKLAKLFSLKWNYYQTFLTNAIQDIILFSITFIIIFNGNNYSTLLKVIYFRTIFVMGNIP